MIFHTFLFVVAVLLSYVRNGFGIIPVMLDCCAVFKIRFAPLSPAFPEMPEYEGRD